MKERTHKQKAAQFKRGNPGRPPMPPEVRAVRQVTREDLVDLAMISLKGDIPALQELLSRAQDKNPLRRPTPIQALMASCILNAIKKGDVNVLNSILDRFFGRMPIAIQVQHTDKPAAGSTAKEIVFETVAMPVPEPTPNAAAG